LSRCFSLPHGNASHEKQYFRVFFFNLPQFLILHLAQEGDLSVSAPLQPGHLFFCLRYAMQIPQFIPQGAINPDLIAEFEFIS
jgi:hypothetical protein